MNKPLKATFAAAAGLALVTGAASAANTITVTDISAWHKGEGGNTGTGDGGLLKLTTDLTDFDSSDADVANWSTTSESWQQESQLNFQQTGAAASDAWYIFDLGSSQAIDSMYIWNITEGGTQRGIQEYELFYTDSPTNAIPHWISDVGGLPDKNSPVAYDFTGWNEHMDGTTLTIDQASKSPEKISGVDEIQALGVTARYIGIKVNSNYGDSQRVGLNQIVFTAVPEPSTTALLGLGGLALILRRRK